MQMHLINSMACNILSKVVFQLRVKYMCSLHCSRKDAQWTREGPLRVTGVCLSPLSRMCAFGVSSKVAECPSRRLLQSVSPVRLSPRPSQTSVLPVLCAIIPFKACLLFHQLDVAFGEKRFCFPLSLLSCNQCLLNRTSMGHAVSACLTELDVRTACTA